MIGKLLFLELSEWVKTLEIPDDEPVLYAGDFNQVNTFINQVTKYLYQATKLNLIKFTNIKI